MLKLAAQYITLGNLHFLGVHQILGSRLLFKDIILLFGLRKITAGEQLIVASFTFPYQIDEYLRIPQINES